MAIDGSELGEVIMTINFLTQCVASGTDGYVGGDRRFTIFSLETISTGRPHIRIRIQQRRSDLFFLYMVPSNRYSVHGINRLYCSRTSLVKVSIKVICSASFRLKLAS